MFTIGAGFYMDWMVWQAARLFIRRGDFGWGLSFTVATFLLMAAVLAAAYYFSLALRWIGKTVLWFGVDAITYTSDFRKLISVPYQLITGIRFEIHSSRGSRTETLIIDKADSSESRVQVHMQDLFDEFEQRLPHLVQPDMSELRLGRPGEK